MTAPYRFPASCPRLTGTYCSACRFYAERARIETMAGRERKVRKWSAAVTRNSDALDLEKNVFEKDDPAEIARSLEKSAERSKRRKATPFRSAMSMLTFYINRAGKNLSSSRKNKLEAAKIELRRIFGGKER